MGKEEEAVVTIHAADGEREGIVGTSRTIIAPVRMNVMTIIVVTGGKMKIGDAWR